MSCPTCGWDAEKYRLAIEEAKKQGFKEGYEMALDDCGVIHGEDAKRFFNAHPDLRETVSKREAERRAGK